MAYKKYVFTCKSQEQEGASSLNSVSVRLNSDEDAITFAANLESLFSVNVITIDYVLSDDYALPYPAGTAYNARLAMWTDTGRTSQARIRNIKAGIDWEVKETALIAAGLYVDDGGATDALITTINTTLFKPGVSH